MGSLTVRAIGTRSVSGGSLTPTLPSGWQAGDLHLMGTGVGNSSETLSDPSGWTLLFNQATDAQFRLYGRIAEGGDTDPSFNWSSTGVSFARIIGFSGDVYTDLSTIVAAADGDPETGTTFPYPGLTVPQDDCLIMVGGLKAKTATSNGITPTLPGGFTLVDAFAAGGTNVIVPWGYLQQTTASNISADVFGATGASYENSASAAWTVALKTANTIVNVPSLFQVRSAMRWT